MDEIDMLLYAPGSFRCDKCGFHQEKRILNASTGEVGIRKDGDEAGKCPNDGERMRRVTWRELHDEIASSYEEIAIALSESVKLQSHYAGILNQHDGGKRRQFSSFREWIERLVETGVIERKPAPDPPKATT
jgi:hypothetical protein